MSNDKAPSGQLEPFDVEAARHELRTEIMSHETATFALDEIDRLRGAYESVTIERRRLEAQVQALQAENERLRAAMRLRTAVELAGAKRLAEQRGAVLRQIDEQADFCPVCGRAPSLGHADDCALDAALPDTGDER